MKAVVDASFVGQVIAGEPVASAPAIERFRALEQMAAPHLLDLEIVAALRRRARSGSMLPAEVITALRNLADARIARWDHVGLLDRVWELRHNVTPYDAAYVALAEFLGWPLLTADQRMARATGPRCKFEIVG